MTQDNDRVEQHAKVSKRIHHKAGQSWIAGGQLDLVIPASATSDVVLQYAKGDTGRAGSQGVNRIRIRLGRSSFSAT